MSDLNTRSVVLNIVSFAKPYKQEIKKVDRSDLPFVLRRLLWEIPLRIPPGCSSKILRRYRALKRDVEFDLGKFMRKISPVKTGNGSP